MKLDPEALKKLYANMLGRDAFRKAYLNEWEESRWKLPVYAVAGSFHFAKMWAASQKVPKELFRYIGSMEDLRGRDHGQVIFLHNWMNLRDGDDIYEYVKHLEKQGRMEIIE